MPDEECGVIGITSTESVSKNIYYGLRILQHRGQESAGISTFNGKTHLWKGMGLVHDVFNDYYLSSLPGNNGVGHVRYSTTGGSRHENAHPLLEQVSGGALVISQNGDLVNNEALRLELTAKGVQLLNTSDGEVILRELVVILKEYPNQIVKALKMVMKKLVGAYSLVVMYHGRIFALRDPYGIKPLVVGTIRHGYCVASESVVFDALEGELIRDVLPGEIIEITKEGITTHHKPISVERAHCMFEWVYFARPDSRIEGVLAYKVREMLGQHLAKEDNVKGDLVVPVPDSGRTYALGYSDASGLPYSEGLIKNRYVDRTFIMPNHSDREISVKLKLNAVREVVEGKSIILVDDSLVRGTTMRKIVKLIRKAGAKEVHVRIGCPPIRAPCYLGIDMKTWNQFAATGRTIDEIGEMIGADSIRYASIEGLVESIGYKKDDLCLGCLIGKYPVPIHDVDPHFQKSLDSFIKKDG